jgi:thiol:disulfide interchange protein DsbA
MAYLLLVPLIACSQQAEPYIAGQQYDVIDTPVRTRDSNKIEVVEIFWYGCPHCYNFEPLVVQWQKNQQDDVDFWSSPAMWSNTMKLHAQAFYTAQALDVADKLHMPLFTTLIVERKPLSSEAQIQALFTDYGVEAEAFSKAFNSFGVSSQVRQADARARSYQITGTPEMVVNGKYRVTASKAGSQAKMLEVVDYLVSKERAAMAK